MISNCRRAGLIEGLSCRDVANLVVNLFYANDTWSLGKTVSRRPWFLSGSFFASRDDPGSRSTFIKVLWFFWGRFLLTAFSSPWFLIALFKDLLSLIFGLLLKCSTQQERNTKWAQQRKRENDLPLASNKTNHHKSKNTRFNVIRQECLRKREGGEKFYWNQRRK